MYVKEVRGDRRQRRGDEADELTLLAVLRAQFEDVIERVISADVVKPKRRSVELVSADTDP